MRTDPMWKTLGRANVLHQIGIERVVLLTTNLPKVDSAGHCAMVAAAPTPELLGKFSVAVQHCRWPALRQEVREHEGVVRARQLGRRVPPGVAQLGQLSHDIGVEPTLDWYQRPHEVRGRVVVE